MNLATTKNKLRNGKKERTDKLTERKIKRGKGWRPHAVSVSFCLKGGSTAQLNSSNL